MIATATYLCGMILAIFFVETLEYAYMKDTGKYKPMRLRTLKILLWPLWTVIFLNRYNKARSDSELS